MIVMDDCTVLAVPTDRTKRMLLRIEWCLADQAATFSPEHIDGNALFIECLIASIFIDRSKYHHRCSFTTYRPNICRRYTRSRDETHCG